MSSPRTRLRLFAQDPRCHWCGRPTALHAHGKPKALLATVDHVKCKEQSASWAEYISASNKVLACYGCNQARNDAFRAANKRPANPQPALTVPARQPPSKPK